MHKKTTYLYRALFLTEIIIFALFFVFSNPVKAQDFSDFTDNGSRGGEVIVEKQRDITAPYRERRNRFGIVFAVNYENFYPYNYFSIIQNDTYEHFLDQNIPLVGAEFAVKYNFQLGSVAAILGYSQGKISDASAAVDEISAAITKLDLNFTLDTLFDEPYVAPFIQVGAHKIDWSETSTAGSVTKEESFTGEVNYHYKAGVSFQLNWIENSIDPSSQRDSVRSGLENTYLDVFYTSYAEPAQVSNASGGEGEADLQSAAYGIGLKLEF